MTDTTQVAPKGGLGKLTVAIISAGSASYLINQLSLSGVNFAELGVSSEVVKSTLVGTMVGFLTGLTPQHLVDDVTSAIVFVKTAFRQWRAAWRSNSN